MSLSRQEASVQRYYDRNTARFLQFARAFSPPAIHQPLYETPGMSLNTALHTHHRMLQDFLPAEQGEFHVLDLGCGVGESLFYLAEHSRDEVSFHGITLSGEQAETARRMGIRRNLAVRVRIHKGSFLALPEHIPRVHLAFAIEAFIHGPDAGGFFREVASRLYPGGQLVLFDDFLSDKDLTAEDHRVLSDFRAGWLANTLIPEDAIAAHALSARLQLVESRDVTAMLRLNRLRDRFVGLIAPIARLFMRNSEYCRFLVGGNARQLAYRKGLLAYRMMRFTC